jgi:hypothetical protein
MEPQETGAGLPTKSWPPGGGRWGPLATVEDPRSLPPRRRPLVTLGCCVLSAAGEVA